MGYVGRGQVSTRPVRYVCMNTGGITRILFVDDEAAILNALKSMMRLFGTGWECRFASSGEEALQLLAQQPADLILCDMCMPGISGAQVLNRVMKEYPQTVRVIMSGFSDEHLVMNAVGVTHQWLGKPWRMPELKALLQRLEQLQSWLQSSEVRSLAGRLSHLPSVPESFHRLQEALSNPESSLDEITAMVAEDPSFAAKMLQWGNSAAFGFSSSSASLLEVVQRLGINRIRLLALSYYLYSAFPPETCRTVPVEQVWEHCVKTAAVAREVANLESPGGLLGEQAFAAGLLHDCGKLALAAGLAAEYREAVDRAQREKKPLSAVEKEQFGATHAQIGASILGYWGLAMPIVEAVAWHHEPAKAPAPGFSALTAVHVANGLVHQSNGAPHVSSVIDKAYLEKLELADHLPVWQEQIGFF